MPASTPDRFTQATTTDGPQQRTSGNITANSLIPERQPRPILVSLLTFSLVLQFGLARIVSFNPSGADGTHGNFLSHILVLLPYVVTFMVLGSSRNAIPLVRKCWPVAALPALAMISLLWSVYPVATFQAGISYLFTTMLGFAIAAVAPPVAAVGIVVRAMGYICILSAACALLFPELGVHQAGEEVQSIHAGYWRGILVHKVTLGLFAGLSLPLIVFYRRYAFRGMLVWLAATVSALACLVNANSMTGILGMIMLFALLHAFSFVVRKPEGRRNGAIATILLITFIFLALIMSGVLNRFAVIVDKSPDLTGRADMWPLIKAVIHSNPMGTIIGYGYVAGFRSFVAPAIQPELGITPSDCHNGYLETLVAFGYAGALLVLLAHVWVFRGTICLLREATCRSAKIAALPISMLLTAAFLNNSESLLLIYSSLFTQLTPIVTTWFAGYSPIRS
jgi:exopolysaccharide production protein ExoQ